jgi:bleomycin hydrolase
MAMEMFDYDSIYNVDMSMTKAQRALYRESIRSHAMVFEGVDVKDDKPIKWWVENSWGKDNGSKGYWTLYDSWFDNHVYNIVVKKEYVPENILKIFDQEHIVLPAWDPMLSVLR